MCQIRWGDSSICAVGHLITSGHAFLIYVIIIVCETWHIRGVRTSHRYSFIALVKGVKWDTTGAGQAEEDGFRASGVLRGFFTLTPKPRQSPHHCIPTDTLIWYFFSSVGMIFSLALWSFSYSGPMLVAVFDTDESGKWPTHMRIAGISRSGAAHSCEKCHVINNH